MADDGGSEALWRRLCPAEVAGAFAAPAARARAGLRAAWAAAPAATRAALKKLLSDVRASDDAGALRTLCMLSSADVRIYGAGVAARGVAIAARVAGGAPPPPLPAPPQPWAGAPTEYQDCGLLWVASVALELAREPPPPLGAALRLEIERARDDASE